MNNSYNRQKSKSKLFYNEEDIINLAIQKDYPINIYLGEDGKWHIKDNKTLFELLNDILYKNK